MAYLKHLIFVTCICYGALANAAEWVSFERFEYQGWDNPLPTQLDTHKKAATNAKLNSYRNPIIPGFYPDPTIVRVGKTYYLTNSSFGYFPGLPIFKSENLIDWQQIGHAITRGSQVNFKSIQSISHGIYAPTLRYHKGEFYIITTDVYGKGNFIIHAKNPAGPWSDPILLPEIGGIDPDLFFDDDGKVYIAHNNAPEGKALYDGHRAIWLWEFDWANKKVVTDSGRVIVNGGADIKQQPIWIEGPHIFKKDNWYYLTCAEGGTGPDHSQVMFRTKSLKKPFIPYAKNPILTQRDLDPTRPNPITAAGHADFVQTPEGEWWAVFLGIRPYEEPYSNTGRETFLLPVTWQQGWPLILPPKTVIPSIVTTQRPIKASSLKDEEFSWSDDFAAAELALPWVTARTTSTPFYKLDKKQLLLQAKPTPLNSKQHASMLVRRQQHLNFNAQTTLQLPVKEGVSGGLIAYQNDEFHYFLGVHKVGNQYHIYLDKVQQNKETRTHVNPIKLNTGSITLGVEQTGKTLEFYWLNHQGQRQILAKGVDATLLSTHVAGGFVGAMVGVHAKTIINEK